jgi:hypothetical protein
MTKNLKSLVQEIQKMASPPPAPPTGYVPIPAPKTPTPNTTPASGAVRRGNLDIQKMQEAIVALAKEVTAQLNSQNLAAPDPRKKQEAGGRDSFADFLTKHFMRNSDVPAVEFTPDSNKKKMEEKDPRAASKLSWVMDTMSRIGHSNTEFEADGIWGPRTSAALDNIFALVSGLFALADAFGAHPKTYTPENLAQLKAGVANSSDFSLTQKIDYASKITKHIAAIRKMYTELKSQILQNPQYQTYIENDTPYLQHTKPTVGFTPTPEQLEVMKKVFPNGFDIYTGNDQQGNRLSKKMPIDSLVTIQALNQWMKTEGVSQDPVEILKQVADQVGGV